MTGDKVVRVLLVEDSASLQTVSEFLELRGGCDVVRVEDPLRADAYVREGSGGLDAIIVDLNMGSLGLSAEEAAETQAGLLTGWIWLTRRLWRQHPHLRERTIIYSNYLGLLRDHLGADELARQIPMDRQVEKSVPVRRLLEQVRRIVGRPESHGVRGLLKRVCSFMRRLESRGGNR